MRRYSKPTFQILGTTIAFVALVLCTVPPSSKTSMPFTPLLELADLVKKSVDPILLQTWASNVVAGNEMMSGEPHAPLPPFILGIPAPKFWTVRIHESFEVKGLKIVELHSRAELCSYGIVVGPLWWVDTYGPTLPVFPGVYVRRYPYNEAMSVAIRNLNQIHLTNRVTE